MQLEDEGRLLTTREDALYDEREKYEAIWTHEQYQNSGSPGSYWAERAFRPITRARPPAYVLDLGCGAGAGASTLRGNGFRVAGLDLVSAQFKLDDVPFFEQTLWEPIPLNPATGRKWSYGFCCDVMEHLPTEYVDPALACMAKACNRVFFSISHMHDKGGVLIGKPLHLTVKPFEWWVAKLKEHFGEIAHGRDLIGEGLYFVKS